MAKPGLEDGFTRIANEILGALSRINLSAYETSVLLFIFRNTYGWQRKEDLLALEFIAEGTGIRKQHICRTLGHLREKKMIVMRKDARGFSLYGFQKDYEQWAVTWRGNQPYQGVTSEGNDVTISGKVITDSGNDVTISGNDVTSLGTQQRNKKERHKEREEERDPPSLPKEVTKREKTMSLFIRLYTGARPGYEPPFSEYPSELVQDEIELMADLWGDEVAQDAIRKAATSGRAVKPKRDYIESIIYRWRDEGKVKPRITKEEYERIEAQKR